MSETSGIVRFLYGTIPGRLFLKAILASHADRLAVAFLRSRCSRPVIAPYARRHGVALEAAQLRSFRSYRDFFLRSRGPMRVDPFPDHLISPCDGWLSACPVAADSSFALKNSHYALRDLLQDPALVRQFEGGVCLIFRLCASDHHHYYYIDDGYQGENHPIPGVLHSVQPIACETYPVYVLNRRCWTLLTTRHFGPVVQTEVGALVVGGICNPYQDLRVTRGMEKGHFDLAGSTILLFFQKGRIELLPDILRQLPRGEVRVTAGMQIGTAALDESEGAL